MDMTPEGRKILEEIRKKTYVWRTERWVLLVLGMFCLIGALLLGNFSISLAGEQEPSATQVCIFAMAITGASVCLMMATALFGIIMGYWRGSAANRLLLEILDSDDSANRE